MHFTTKKNSAVELTDPRLSRLTNNVENWFKILKNSILQNEIVMPSQLVANLFSRLELKYYEHYYQENDKIFISLKDKVEKWKNHKTKCFKRTKGHYCSFCFQRNNNQTF